MNLRFEDVVVRGLVVVVPNQERSFVEEMDNYSLPRSRTLQLKDVMGLDRRRVVAGEACVSDLAVHGLEALFRDGVVDSRSIDAIVVTTSCPDYFIPPTSHVIHGRLALKKETFCLDISQGCAGFVVGLIQTFMLLQQNTVNRVVLVNGDVLSRKVNKRDRNSFPLVGDAVAITVVDRQPQAGPVFANVFSDGTLRDALIIPAGGFRQPSSRETAEVRDAGDGNFRSLDDLRMDGTAVFNFVQREVPEMVKALLSFASESLDSVDYFLFHQANQFMLTKLADRMGIPRNRMPSNVCGVFGNSSGATIPTCIAHNLSDELRSSRIRACFAGFGAGLTWCSILSDLGPLEFSRFEYY